ncbi:hypothetical protein LINPERPRIM_LOCUS5751 [Linum perenne]
MAKLNSLIFIILFSFSSLLLPTSTTEEIRSPEALDLLIRDYTFKSYDNMNSTTKTGDIHDVNIPANLSGITARAVRFRCGSLIRYGARIDGFSLGGNNNNNNSLIVSPCVERVMLITTNFGLNWSSTIYNHLLSDSGYRLVSTVLGLTAYSAASKNSPNSSYPFEIGIRSTQGNPITVNFTNIINTSSSLCAIFGRDGKVSLKPHISPGVCSSSTTGHYALVVKVLLPQPPNPPPEAAAGEEDGGGGRAAAWKVAVGSSIGGVMAIVLLGLLMVAMFGKAKKKAKMVELERKAYEEEALQVSMVGHVRAPLASSTRTVPTIENDQFMSNYNPSSRRKK